MASFLKGFFGGAAARRVEVRPFGACFDVPSGQTVLESALAHNVPFPHNCTVGTCGSCKSRLVCGRVKAITDFGYTLSRQELEAGYILACQAVPRDELTVVEVESTGRDLPAHERFTGNISAAEALTHDIVRVTVELDRPLRYVAGQYANVRSPNVVRPRCYSFADAPDRNGRKDVNFMIRRVPGGGFTDALFSGRLEGVRLEIEAPLGSFFLRTSAHPMICVAGGSGLAPLLSILEDARRMNVRRRCAVLFGARTTGDLYALDRLRDIQAAWLGGCEFIPVLSAEPAQSGWTGCRGMVTEFVASALPDADWSQVEGYLCGPPGMVDAAIDVLTGLGTGLGSIHYDKFTDESHVAAQI